MVASLSCYLCAAIVLFAAAVCVLTESDAPSRKMKSVLSEPLIYGAASPPKQLRPRPFHSESENLIQRSHFNVPGLPLDPFSINVSPAEEEVNHHYPGIESLQDTGNSVLRSSVDAAEADPPATSSLPELGPQRLHRTTWKSTPVTYFDRRTNYFDPAPRLWATDLDELQLRRSLYMDEHYPEPPSKRQEYVQLLTAGFRSRKDKYTRATPTNDLAHLSGQKLKKAVPTYTNF